MAHTHGPEDAATLAARLGDVVFAVRTGTAGAQEIADAALAHLTAAGWRNLLGGATKDAPEAAYEAFRTTMLANLKPIAWHAAVDAVWAVAVEQGRRLAAADVAGYGRALCAEFGDSPERIATYGGFTQAWTDAEALALHGPAGAGLRLVRNIPEHEEEISRA
jgi:hypothetical protein